MELFNLPFVIIRPLNNYGPKQHLEKLIPRFITSIYRNEKITIHGNGNAMRDYIHVKDTCDAIYKLIKSNKKMVRFLILGVEKNLALMR